MQKRVATHNGVMHADEISAVALLKIFSKEEIVVQRVSHQYKDLSQFDMVIDIGKKHDGKKYFDHHQYKGGKSSAGLIWDYLGIHESYPKLSKLIKQIDNHDTGVQKAKEFEFPSLLITFNSKEIYSKEQDENFNQAVLFAMRIFNALLDADEEKKKAKEIVNNSFFFNNNKKIIELSEYTKHWNSYINGKEMPDIKAIVWEDRLEDGTSCYKTMVTPKYAGSFELTTKGFQADDSMEFVHKSGFFAIAKDCKTMERFLQKQIK